MVVYRDLESIEADLKISLKQLYTLSNELDCHYHMAEIPKRCGGVRRLCVPDESLKYVQRRICEVLLVHMPISPYATAYRYGAKTRFNALPHVGKKCILKLDISHFFDSILYSQVKESAFPESIYSEKIRVLLSILCYYKESLPQGAPTSPAISNIIMREFDEAVGEWCNERGIAYTRYCDDMTFSGDFIPAEVRSFVGHELKKYGFFLNPAKTKTAQRGTRQTVTGIVVNEKTNLPSEYRKRLRQELYYCRKFGVYEDIKRIHAGDAVDVYLKRLLGRVNYVLSVRPDDTEMLNYRSWLIGEMKIQANR